MILVQLLVVGGFQKGFVLWGVWGAQMLLSERNGSYSMPIWKTTPNLFQIRTTKILFKIHSVYFLLKYKIMLEYYSNKLQWEFKSMFTSLVLLDGNFYFGTAQYIVTAAPCLRVYKQRLRGQYHTRFVLNLNAVVFYNKVQTCKRCV